MTEIPGDQRSARPNIFKRFGQYLARQNLFNDDESLAIGEQLFSTRLYVSLLAVSIFVLLTLAGLKVPAVTATVTSPSLSLFEYLSNRYPSTLSCPCSQPVIPYDVFLSFAPRYHQVCSSVFVSQSWISTLFSFQLSHYYPLDFRTAASSQFQVLGSLCRFAAQSIADSLKTLSMHQLITISALSRTVLDRESAVLAQKLQSTVIADVNLIDEYVAFTIAQNYLSSSLRTTHYFISSSAPGGSQSMRYLWDENLSGDSVNDYCFCYQAYSCSAKVRLYNMTLPYNTRWILHPDMSALYVPGMKAGCIPHDSMLNATLECFYNATCIQTLLQFMSGTIFPDSLDDTVQSRFKPNMTIRSMFSELFIEDWNYTSNFTGYFDSCAPVSCSYSYTERFNAAYMFIIFFGFIGGMTVLLGFGAPVLVKNVVRRIKTICSGRNEHEQQMPSIDNEAATRPSLRERPVTLLRNIMQIFITLNLFKTSSGVQRDIWSTRIYLFLLIVASSTLAIYTSVTLHTITVTVHNPSWANFQQIYANYSPGLFCPCTDISVPYASFITIQPRFHQVCSSDFVQIDRWLAYFTWLSGPNSVPLSLVISLFDFRFTAHTDFFFMRTLCQLAKETITNAIDRFNETEFVSGEPLPEAYFDAQTSLMIHQFEEDVSSYIVGVKMNLFSEI